MQLGLLSLSAFESLRVSAFLLCFEWEPREEENHNLRCSLKETLPACDCFWCEVSRHDLFHGHLFRGRQGRMGMLLHACEYPMRRSGKPQLLPSRPLDPHADSARHHDAWQPWVPAGARMPSQSIWVSARQSRPFGPSATTCLNCTPKLGMGAMQHLTDYCATTSTGSPAHLGEIVV